MDATRQRWPSLVVPWLAAAACLLMPAIARAYPQWQFTTGATRCNQCHFAPAGGGLINGYGRDANGEDLSTFAGDGAFLHGTAELPSFLKLGADLRLALMSHDNRGPDSPKTALFPMQADLHVRVNHEAFAFQMIGGVRGQVRRTDAPVPPDAAQPENASRLVSREHWAIWQPQAQGHYLRAGRFFAPFGLRLAEHLVNVRRDLGFNTLQETYNVSGGFLSDDWEAHLTLLGPDFLQSGTREKGVAAFGEYRMLDQTASIGAQSKFSNDAGLNRWVGGVIAKLHLQPASLLLMLEANYVRQMPVDVDAGVGQFVGLIGASWLPPFKGLLLTAWAEQSQGDVTTVDTGVAALTGLLSWFPYPHFEVQLVGRGQAADDGALWSTFFAQLHYFL